MYPRLPVPTALVEVRPWRQLQRGGTRADRMLDRIEVCIPGRLADLTLPTPADLAAMSDQAVRAVTIVDTDHGPYLGALSGLLLRTESVASSKIEAIEASTDDYARALHGSRANESATAMVAASAAVGSLMNEVDAHGHVRLIDVLAAHTVLMRDDPREARHAGALRTMQNWIGGSDYSPRGADYVPPPPELVPELIEDLFNFIARTDIPSGIQAAIAHAQFELIHPFTDGNGRIGRSLINAVLRARGVTNRVVIPAASVLMARRSDYFSALGAFRGGDAGPIASLMVMALLVAAEESSITAIRLQSVHQEWRSRLATNRAARSGSAPMLALDHLLVNPVVNAEGVHAFLGGSVSRTYATLDRLHAAGIIEPLTDRKRNQVWAARDLLDELTDLDSRIQSRARTLDPPYR